MNTFILIVIIFTGVGSSQRLVTFSQEFNTLAACQTASSAIKGKVDDVITVSGETVTICVPKGHIVK